MYNHDTRKWEGLTESIIHWSDRKYISWLQKEVTKSGKQTKDNSWMWDNGIKFSTQWEQK